MFKATIYHHVLHKVSGGEHHDESIISIEQLKHCLRQYVYVFPWYIWTIFSNKMYTRFLFDTPKKEIHGSMGYIIAIADDKNGRN